ncbi:guanine nucleotide exchange factor [Anaeramoeba flamelloides]|uniref:Guanine nucleotide exchange factor n=1 Tax=Anaeramoeba flamelloides TaxID=1746091 RepID=A0ABQ8X4Q5_9EUKA|nr:guanine nucleotide exchange factor [Anaeramoeba flamelloides]
MNKSRTLPRLFEKIKRYEKTNRNLKSLFRREDKSAKGNENENENENVKEKEKKTKNKNEIDKPQIEKNKYSLYLQNLVNSEETRKRKDHSNTQLTSNQEGIPKQTKANLETLLKEIVTKCSYDPELMKTFLLVYPCFCSVPDIFKILTKYFNFKQESQSKAIKKRYRELKLIPLRFSILFFVQMWVRFQNKDFSRETNKQSNEVIGRFLENNLSLIQPTKTRTLQIQINKGIVSSQERFLNSSLQEGNILNAPQPILPQSLVKKKKLKFDEISPIEMSRQLTLIDQELVRKVTPHSFYPFEYIDKQKVKQRDVHLYNYLMNFETTRNMIAQSILDIKKKKNRLKRIGFWIEVMLNLIKVNNFNTLFALMSGLQIDSITRLDETWSGLSGQLKREIDNIKVLVSPMNNYRKYRQTVKKCKPPYILFFDLIIYDLQLIDYQNKDFADPETIKGKETTEKESALINYDKFIKISAILKNFQLLKNYPFAFQKIPEIQNYLSNIQIVSEEELMERSINQLEKTSKNRSYSLLYCQNDNYFDSKAKSLLKSNVMKLIELNERNTDTFEKELEELNYYHCWSINLRKKISRSNYILNDDIEEEKIFLKSFEILNQTDDYIIYSDLQPLDNLSTLKTNSFNSSSSMDTTDSYSLYSAHSYSSYSLNSSNSSATLITNSQSFSNLNTFAKSTRLTNTQSNTNTKNNTNTASGNSNHSSKQSTKVNNKSNNNPIIVGGTLEWIVSYICDYKKSDPDFLKLFLFTYPTFATPIAVFKLLKRQYLISPPKGLTEKQNQIFTNKILKSIKFKVFNFINHWMNYQSIDFQLNATFSKKMEKFIENIIKKDETMKRSGLMLEKKLKQIVLGFSSNFQIKTNPNLYRSKSSSSCLINNRPKPILSKNLNLNNFQFFDLDPVEFSRQITLVEFTLYKSIHPNEFLNQSWTNQEKRDVIAPNLMKFIRYFKGTTLWITNLILSQEKLSERINCLKSFLKIADKCLEYRNFNTAYQIYVTLNTPVIYRLRKTWDGLSNGHKKFWIYLNKFMKKNDLLDNINKSLAHNKNDRNHSHYHSQNNNSHHQNNNNNNNNFSLNKPTLPNICSYFYEFISIDEIHNDFLYSNSSNKKLINFEKRRKIFFIINQIKKFQENSFGFKKIRQISKWILKNAFTPYKEENFFKQSLKIEPKK